MNPLPGCLPLLIAAVLAGCGSTSPAVDEILRAPTQQKDPWFCQVGVDDTSWECVQDRVLASKPRPDRLPLAATAPAESDAAPATAEELPIQAPPVAANEPKYQRLAYRPNEAISLLDLPKTFWAAQLIALPSRELLEEYAAEHQLRGMSAARVAVKDNLFYVLLLGIYETKEIAQEATADLPAPFDYDKPWIRSVGSLQEAMLRGDEIAAGPTL